MGCFELLGDSSNAWKINSDLADYASKHIETSVSNQTLEEGIFSANSVSQNKENGNPMNQDKSLVNLQERIFFILFMGHLAKFGQL